jgi:hypothetical protein
MQLLLCFSPAREEYPHASAFFQVQLTQAKNCPFKQSDYIDFQTLSAQASQFCGAFYNEVLGIEFS